MATFRAGRKTDRAVLPQQLALEFASADTPENRDETGRERHTTQRRAASGAGHVRGETPSGAPAVGRVTSDHPVRAQGRKAQIHPAVFVLDKHGTPLQPTTPARARRLLTQGRAVVHRHTPFVIRLKNRTVEESSVQGVELGIDPGSKHTGMAIFTTTHMGRGTVRCGLYAIELGHRGEQIRGKLAQRAAYRRRRRTRNLRHRAPRFLNRARPKGWLAPSLKHRVDTVLSWASRLGRWAPITAVHIERVAFDTHVLSAGRPLEAAEYRHGTLYGCEVREYLLMKWGNACAYCGSSDQPLNIDHLQPRSRGGSDRVSNLVLACIPCNQAKGNHPVKDFLAHRPQVLATVLAQAKATLRDAAAVNTTRWALWRAVNRTKPVHGYMTGDLARAVVPTGRKAGTHTGRIAVRSSGSFNIRTRQGLIQGIQYTHFRLLQRADGYAYTTRPEAHNLTR